MCRSDPWQTFMQLHCHKLFLKCPQVAKMAPCIAQWTVWLAEESRPLRRVDQIAQMLVCFLGETCISPVLHTFADTGTGVRHMSLEKCHPGNCYIPPTPPSPCTPPVLPTPTQKRHPSHLPHALNCSSASWTWLAQERGSVGFRQCCLVNDDARVSPMVPVATLTPVLQLASVQHRDSYCALSVFPMGNSLPYRAKSWMTLRSLNVGGQK